MSMDMRSSLEVLIEREREKKRRRSLIILAALAAVICFLLFQVVFGIAVVSGDSMAPGIPDGSIVIFNRLESEYEAEDVVITFLNDKEIIKRIDSIENGQVFLKGDNEAVSIDSRKFGTISEEEIVGRVVCMIRVL